jgi:hypothetical protein
MKTIEKEMGACSKTLFLKGIKMMNVNHISGNDPDTGKCWEVNWLHLFTLFLFITLLDSWDFINQRHSKRGLLSYSCIVLMVGKLRFAILVALSCFATS